jgi:hypothetical protein
MDAGTTQTNVHDRDPSQVHAAHGRAVSALAHVEHGHRDAMEELRVALCEYVGALRRAGESRETTLSIVRTVVTTPASPEGALALTPIVREALAELTLEWCEAEYNRLADANAG